MALLPVVGGGLGHPQRYALTLPNGQVDLGEVWDLDTLVARLWRDEEAQQRLTGMWQAQEQEVQAQGKVVEFLTDLETKARSLTFPALPTGSVVRTHAEHLRLAIRAVVVEYVERARR